MTKLDVIKDVEKRGEVVANLIFDKHPNLDPEILGNLLTESELPIFSWYSHDEKLAVDAKRHFALTTIVDLLNN